MCSIVSHLLCMRAVNDNVEKKNSHVATLIMYMPFMHPCNSDFFIKNLKFTQIF